MAWQLGVDGGNDSVKLFGPNGELLFTSVLGEYRERKLEQVFSEDDMAYEFLGKKGFAGTLAQFESQFTASKMGDSKAHQEFLIRVLLGLHRYSGSDLSPVFQIVVGQPIIKHTLAEKKKMKEMLEGPHVFTINGVTKTIVIERAEISAEGGAAFWSAPQQGIVRILDFGSGTVNGASLNDGRYVDKQSFTEREGLNTMLTDDIGNLVRKVALKSTGKYGWEIDDKVLVCGGGAEKALPSVLEYFPQAALLRPKKQIQDGNGMKLVPISPIFANAVGFYHIAKKVFANG